MSDHENEQFLRVGDDAVSCVVDERISDDGMSDENEQFRSIDDGISDDSKFHVVDEEQKSDNDGNKQFRRNQR